MRRAGALLLAAWRAARSYRLRMLFSILALCVTIVPVAYIARALQPMMADRIRGEGQQYFAFVLVGMMVFSLLGAAVTALPDAIGTGIANGSLEAMLTTPITVRELLAGLVSYDLSWAVLRAIVMLATGAVLGAHYAWTHVASAAAIVALIVVAHLPFGVIGGALVLAFRTTGPLPQAVLLLSGLLGGVYFPTHVVPEAVRYLSAALPLTYGLRALRAVMLEGRPLWAAGPDVLVLSAMAAVLMAAASLLMRAALHHVRRAGTLSQY